MAVAPVSPDDAGAYPQLFDSSADYATLIQAGKEAGQSCLRWGFAEITRLQKRLRRNYEYRFFVAHMTALSFLRWCFVGDEFLHSSSLLLLGALQL